MSDSNATEEKQDDGVQRDKLDYRAGYVEGLASLLQLLNMKALRATKKTEAGLREAFDTAKDLRDTMIAKMRGGK